MQPHHKARAVLTRHRAEQATFRWLRGWKSAHRDFGVLSLGLLGGTRGTAAGSLALWIHAGRSLLGRNSDSDEGLNFKFDAETESTGPRYAAQKYHWGTALPKLIAVKSVGTKPPNPLTKDNLVLRIESRRLSVTLINLRNPSKRARYGKYEVELDSDGQTVVIPLSARRGRPGGD